MNIYLDIDEVLLESRVSPAHYVDEFLEVVMNNWPDSVYWLSPHCRGGINRANEILEPVLRAKTFKLTQNIQPTDWGELKTDAIDFKTPFLWFDTDIYNEEREILKHYNALGCFRRINLSRDPLQLLNEIVHLRSLIPN